MADDPKVIIVDKQGNRHIFPAGFDPKLAGAIVQKNAPASVDALDSGVLRVGLQGPQTASDGPAQQPDWKADANEGLQGLAHPQSMEDILSMIVPSQLGGVLGVTRDPAFLAAGRDISYGAKAAAADTSGTFGSLLKYPGKLAQKAWQATNTPEKVIPGLERTATPPSNFPSPAGYNFIDNAISAAKTNPETAPGLNLLGHQLGTNPDNLAFERFAGQDHMFEGRKLGDILSSPGSADYLARESQANAPIARKVLGDAVKPSPSIQLREPPTGPPAAPQFTIKPPGEAPNSVNLRPPKPSGQPIEAWHAKAAPGSKNAQAAQSLHIAEGQPDPLRNAGYHPRTPARPDPELEALLRSLRFRGGQ